jgi:PKD repeat protein
MATLLTSNHDGTLGSSITAAFYSSGLVTATGSGGSVFSDTWRRGASGTSVRFDAALKNFRYTRASKAAQAAWRGYYNFEAAPATVFDFMRMNNAVGATLCAVAITPTGQLRLKEGVTEKWTSTGSLVNTPSRIELRYNTATSVIRCRVFRSTKLEAVASDPSEDSGDIALALEPGGADVFIWGWMATAPVRYWVDDIALADGVTDFIGPVAGASPPAAAFTLAPTGGDAPLTVQFTDTSTGSPTSWLWNFGDGGPTSTSQNPSHVYSTAGTYTVTLTATNAGGSNVTTRSITVTTPAVATVPVNVWKNGILNLRTGAQRKVRVAGTLKTIVLINGIGGVTPPPPPPPPVNARFAGDPGVGKAYIGSNRPGQAGGNTESGRVGWYEDKMQLWATEIGPRKQRPIPIIRSYISGSAGVANEPGYPWLYPERTNIRTISRRLVQWAHDKGAIPWCEIGVYNQPQPSDSSQDAWMNNLASALDKGLTGLNALETEAINEVKTLATHCKQFAPNPIWLSLNHEPEDDVTPSQPARLTAYRKAQRAIILTLRREGVTNVANLACTYMTMTLRVQGGRDWRTWYPDWKGTSSNGATALNGFPNNSAADFYTGTTKTGALDESVVDVVGHDIYYWSITGAGKEWSPTTSVANADAFDVNNWLTDHNHGMARKIFQVLGKPWAIGEIGTQAAGYLDGNGTLIQRTKDIEAMRSLGKNLGLAIGRGEIVGVCYFNSAEHAFGQKDPDYSKALSMSELFDRYSVAPPIT